MFFLIVEMMRPLFLTTHNFQTQFGREVVFELEKLLNKNGIIIIHRSKKIVEILPKNFQIIQIKTYGISKIIFGY